MLSYFSVVRVAQTLCGALLLATTGFAFAGEPVLAQRAAKRANAVLLQVDHRFSSGQQSTDGFGMAVAIQGNLAVVNSPSYWTPGSQVVGAAFVYELDENGWSAPTVLQAGDPAVSIRYATSVAISGTTLVIGAYNDVLGGGPGRADIFEKVGHNWIHQAELTTPTATVGFGTGVAIDGDVVVVGDPGDQSATIFERSGGQWSEIQRLQELPVLPGTKFGNRVLIEDDLIVVARPYYPSFESRKGAIHIYRRVGGTWAHEHQFALTDGGRFPEMGEAIAMDGGRILAGAYGYEYALDNISLSRVGAVFALEKVESEWISSRLLGSVPGYFGTSVGLQGDAAVIGAAAFGGGRVFTFVRNAPGEWVETQIVSPPLDLPSSSAFGVSLAFEGDRVLVGAPPFGPAPSALAQLYLTSPTRAPQVTFSIDDLEARVCPQWPGSTVVRWNSNAVSCRALDAIPAPALSSWQEAACRDPASSCGNPRDFTVLEPSGSARITTHYVDTDRKGQTLSIECTDAEGYRARVSIPLRTRYFGAGSCPAPTHSVAPAFSQGPTALADGTFEMRATINNPQGKPLVAIARQYSQSGTAHARIEGDQLILVFAPALTLANPLLSISIGADVSDGEVSVQRIYQFNLDLRLYSDGFESAGSR